MWKISILFLLFGSSLMSCERNWIEKDKTDFIQGCLRGGAIKDLGEARAKKYCSCMLQTIMIKYPNRNDARHLQWDTTLNSLGRGCLNPP